MSLNLNGECEDKSRVQNNKKERVVKKSPWRIITEIRLTSHILTSRRSPSKSRLWKTEIHTNENVRFCYFGKWYNNKTFGPCWFSIRPLLSPFCFVALTNLLQLKYKFLNGRNWNKTYQPKNQDKELCCLPQALDTWLGKSDKGIEWKEEHKAFIFFADLMPTTK